MARDGAARRTPCPRLVGRVYMTPVADALRVIQYGLGPIGCAAARLVHERGGLQLVGGVDIDPAKVGRDLGEVVGIDGTLGIPVRETLAQALADGAADVVCHTTSSYFPLFKGQIVEILGAGLDVVSTSEELSFPWHAHADEGRELDAAAKAAGKTVLGTGINPGFLMDTLPITLTALCQTVERVDVERVIDASKRRGPFQRKIGSGMTVEAFRGAMDGGRMGHVGLPESMAMLLDTLGHTLVRYEDSVEPVVAEHAIETDALRVEAGQVMGLRQVGRGFTAAGEIATLTFHAALEVPEDGDTIRITGRPDLTVKLRGTHGDLGTVAVAVNAIRRVCEAAPGLVTMRDLPPVCAR